MKKSRMGKWRAAVLIGVHVLAALHIWHWLATGRTVTPVEPSESMYTISKGLVNAGLVLFLLAILSTFIFGRFFCGWGCHIIALQDASTWLLKKIGIHPKPFRSRLLIFVPLLAAIYMFIIPLGYRLWVQYGQGSAVPPLEPHFTTEDFWDTFPGFWVGGLTFLTVGFLIVYFLGNKGFCTYGCPYGGIFGVADRFAPVRIRVTDDCEQCGHCTASCTSNVRVHEEVRDYRMIVDPGCMKCLDCIDVCPKDALYVGVGRPASGAKQKRQGPAKQPRSYDFSWAEEIALAAFFVLTMLVLRFFEQQQLYEGFPLLFALGLSAISAYLLLMFARLFYQPNQRVARWNVKKAGRLTKAGRIFAGAMALWIAFLAHSATVQTAEWYATEALNRAKDAYARANVLDESSRAQFASSLDSLKHVANWSLIKTYRIEGKIGSALRYLGREEEAKPYFERAVAKSPSARVEYRDQLAQIAIAQQNLNEALHWLNVVVEKRPEFENATQQLVDLQVRIGKPEEALATLHGAIAKRPRNHTFRFMLASTLQRLGRGNEAVNVVKEYLTQAHEPANAYVQVIPFLLGVLGRTDLGSEMLDEALQKFPDNAAINQFAAMRAGQMQDLDVARAYIDKSLATAPKSSESQFIAFQIAFAQQDLPRAQRHLDAALELAPERKDFLQAWAQLSAVGGTSDKLANELEGVAAPTRAQLLRLLALYELAGKTDKAVAIRKQLEKLQ
ncbi:MAG: tetratricopeptide repeat protein [Phycisphaerae bacterium]